MTKDVNELLTNGKLRESLIGKVEVLDKVKGLLLLPNSDMATVKQLSAYYEVPETTIQSLVNENMIELTMDGYGIYKKDEVIGILNVENQQLESLKGKVIATFDNGSQIVIPNRGLRLFPRRAILRVGMLLKGSKVAIEVQNQLLNIEEKTPNEVKVADIKEEQKLATAIGMAVANGDLTALSEANAKMMAFKNRHINKLKEVIDVQQPKVEYHDQVLKPSGLMNITSIAKDLGMSAVGLNNLLKELKIIFKTGSTYVPYAKYQYLVTDGFCDYENFNNEEMGVNTNILKWTEKGRKFIIDTLSHEGLLN